VPVSLHKTVVAELAFLYIDMLQACGGWKMQEASNSITRCCKPSAMSIMRFHSDRLFAVAATENLTFVDGIPESIYFVAARAYCSLKQFAAILTLAWNPYVDTSNPTIVAPICDMRAMRTRGPAHPSIATLVDAFGHAPIVERGHRLMHSEKRLLTCCALNHREAI
jgi:hypothetical protein